MSKSYENGEKVIDDRNLCTYLLRYQQNDYCTCPIMRLKLEVRNMCEVCRYYTPETGKFYNPLACKWEEDGVCCNADSPIVGDFPQFGACLTCKYWETKI